MDKIGKIGVLGGTFNPIHNGHIHLALEYCRRLSLDKVLVIPTRVPPHKQAEELASGEERLALCRLACLPYPKLVPCDIELKRKDKSFTVDTLRELKEQYPEEELYFLMGSDMFLTVDRWKESQKIFAMAVLCTGARETGEFQVLLKKQAELESRGAKCVVSDFPVLEISSSEIRRKLAEGEPVQDLLPLEVEDAIRKKRLYHSWKPELDRWVAVLEKKLSPSRLYHSQCVAEAADRLALQYGESQERAYLAGLVHDICKEMPGEEQQKWIAQSGMTLDAALQKNPQVWHGFAAAAYLQSLEEGWRITDSELLNAVRYHTTARAGMTGLEKIVYVADFLSADRTFPDAQTMRELAERSLEEAMRFALTYTVKRLTQKGIPICRDTREAYQEIITRIEKGGTACGRTYKSSTGGKGGPDPGCQES